MTQYVTALIVEKLKLIDMGEWSRTFDSHTLPIYIISNRHLNCSVLMDGDDFARTNSDDRYCLALWNQTEYRYFRGAEVRDLYKHLQKQWKNNGNCF